MTAVFPERGRLTDDLLTHLAGALTAAGDVGILVGDGAKPLAEAGTPGGGWAGEPNSSQFTPYVVLGTGEGSVRNPSLGQPHGSWALTYTIDWYGSSRSQADWVADTARKAVLDYAGRIPSLGEHRWKITAVRWARLGGLRPNHAEDPPLWGGQDVAALWVDVRRG